MGTLSQVRLLSGHVWITLIFRGVAVWAWDKVIYQWLAIYSLVELGQIRTQATPEYVVPKSIPIFREWRVVIFLDFLVRLVYVDKNKSAWEFGS